MSALTWIAGTLLMLHHSNSYVLLTANLGDVGEMMGMAKQLAQLPVVSEISKIWQRASDQFKKQYNKELANTRVKKHRRPKHSFDMNFEAKHRSQHDEQVEDERVERRSQSGEEVKHNRQGEERVHPFLSSSTLQRPRQSNENVERDSQGGERLERHRQDEESTMSVDDDVISLGKNASYYLKSIRRIFENL